MHLFYLFYHKSAGKAIVSPSILHTLLRKFFPRSKAHKKRPIKKSVSVHKHGADPLVGQCFDEDGMLHPSVDDKYFFNAAADRLAAAIDFRNHPSRDDSLFDERRNIAHINFFNEARFVVLVAQNALRVCHEDEAGRPERPRDDGGSRVGIDVIDMPLVVVPDGGNNGDIAGVESVGDDLRIHFRYFADIAELFVRLAALHHVPVDTAETERLAPDALQKIDERFVDFAREHEAGFIIRGIRTVHDFEYEETIADINRKLAGVETILLFTEPELTSISSTIVRELLQYGKDVSDFLPEGMEVE